MALSFGVLYPQFSTENAAQIPTSFGGIVYMMSSLSVLAIIIMIEAIPVTRQLLAWRRGETVGLTLDLIAVAAAVLVICAVATILPLRLAARRLEQMEW